MAHSLGNMVVSEALLKGANARAYVMLDAAVASEAYRPELQADSDEIIATTGCSARNIYPCRNRANRHDLIY